MPNGRCHSAATVAATSALLSYFMAGNEWAIWSACGAFMGLVVEPDLDQDYQAAPMGTIRQTGGRWMVLVWQLYWTPYARIFPHRSLWTHAPIVGTLGRFLYMLPLYSVPILVWNYFFGFPAAQIFAFLVGLAWVDALHYVMDFLVPRQLFPQNPYRK